jgi:Fe-S-cluster containining protein
MEPAELSKTAPPKTAPPKITLRLVMLGETIAVEADRPPERVRLDEVLPLLRMVDDRAIDISVAKHGQPVTCAKGCSACCRAQPVPVTPPETYALLRLVERMDQPRRAEILSRFADRAARLEAAGIAGTYLRRSESLTPEQARATVTAYLGLGLVCPFLENDACGIYEDRPFVCRQYLVTSPKELCVNPLELPVQPVPMPLAPATAMLDAATGLSGTPQYTVPLTLALVYAQTHRDELERTYPAESVFTQSIRSLVVSSTSGS